MDITSTAAMSNPIAQTPSMQKPITANTPTPDETNLQAIREEIQSISSDIKTKLKPLEQDTIEFSKPAPAAETKPQITEEIKQPEKQ